MSSNIADLAEDGIKEEVLYNDINLEWKIVPILEEQLPALYGTEPSFGKELYDLFLNKLAHGKMGQIKIIKTDGTLGLEIRHGRFLSLVGKYEVQMDPDNSHLVVYELLPHEKDGHEPIRYPVGRIPEEK